ncbi:uncharacterized protein MELLADRAFT_70593 [Melampsora larici-populina 98AG31]|uniref:PUB domain-containing protein n=1 Tax=Melampsora larici-populina (strain 98AG31 / pathotype 3-4-7) TaxID=747676 RepID=F4R689_MELLP|nr:uncharacterized protein MELLADRAFT_70593 [Melampsora larici-populina 98AG31]EGG11841.1 hypothetical protein MELLADRAFT_70593 [Melampsora larici-populina 98AG31]
MQEVGPMSPYKDPWDSESQPEGNTLRSPTGRHSSVHNDIPINAHDVASAAETRRKTVNPIASTDGGAAIRKSFVQLIEGQLVERNEKAVVLEALKTMEKITSNVLKNPGEAKYKTVKHSNELIKRNIINVAGARDYLLACKFSAGVKDHVETLNFPENPSERILEVLAIGHQILTKKISDITQAHETAIRMKQAETEAIKRQKALALNNIQEDRERQKLRLVREKMAREAKEKEAESNNGQGDSDS